MASVTQVLAAIRSHESASFSNPYGLTPEQNVDFPRSHASGAYQFQPATWQSYTAQSGIGTQYPQAYQAPPGVQDAVAAWVVTNKGTGDWSPYSGALPSVTSVDVTPEQLAAGSGLGNTSQFAGDPLGGTLGGPAFDNPNSPLFGLQNDPLSSGFGGTGNFGVTDFTAGSGINASLGFDPTQQGQAILDANPGIGQTVGQGVADITQGAVTGAAAAPGIAGSLGSLFGTSGGNTDTSSTWFNRLKQDIGDVVARIGIGLLALILIGLAAWAFTAGGGIGAARDATARTIKKSAGFT